MQQAGPGEQQIHGGKEKESGMKTRASMKKRREKGRAPAREGQVKG
jgi:hypothetical protein